MTQEPLMLRFEGPFGLTKDRAFLFDQTAAKEAGIYLWTVPYHEGGYLVTYIGETGASFANRIKDHLIQTVGGNYRICDPDLLIKGNQKILWNGLWRRGTRDRLLEYIEKIEEFAPIIRKGLRIEQLFLVPLTVEKRIRQRIEGALALHVKSQPPPASSVLPSDIRYNGRKELEAPIMVRLECKSFIHGIPSRLNV